MYEEKINAYFDAPERRAELVEAISRLVRIRSVREAVSYTHLDVYKRQSLCRPRERVPQNK